jgi:cytochrome c553
MRRLALAALGVALLVPVAASRAASPLDYVLGAYHRLVNPTPPADARFPHAAPPAEWEPWLAEGDAHAGEALYTQGRYERVQACIACHGRNGAPAGGSPFPRLGGVSADYIAKQLADFRAGRRKNDIMNGIARQMTEQDVGSVSLYLASLTPDFAPIVPDTAQGRGRQLQELGDNAHALPACGNCHGPQGRGFDRLLPPLAGLPATYLNENLHAWKSGTRANDLDSIMRNVGAKLSDEDIQALASYYAAIK